MRFTRQHIVRLRDADIQDFKALDLRGADLRGVNLRGALLAGADLRNADLWLSDLRDTDMARADLSNAILVSADLRGADLRKAFFRRADLNKAKLEGITVNWHSIDLIAAILCNTFFERRQRHYAILAKGLLAYPTLCYKHLNSTALPLDFKEASAVILKSYVKSDEELPTELSRQLERYT